MSPARKRPAAPAPPPPAAAEAPDWRGVLDAALAAGALPDLAAAPEAAVDAALRALGRERGADAVPFLTRLASEGAGKAARKAARRELYRLAQAGVVVEAAPAPAPPPLVRREAVHAVEAWVSGIDGAGSRGIWLLFEGGLGGGLHVASLILNDQVGIMEVGGGPVTRKRFDAQLATLREGPPTMAWVETPPGRAAALVQEALDRHRALGTEPPAAFATWRAPIAAIPAAPAPPAVDAVADRAALEAALPLLERPELLGWFVDPAALQEDAVALLEARDSRLVVSDQIKAERETAIVDRAIARAFTPEWRPRWARRFAEMALVYRALGQDEAAGWAETIAAAFADADREPTTNPVARTLTTRGLELAGEVTLGRARLAEVTRAPSPRGRDVAARPPR